jgi:hypothetical protein
MSDEYIKSCPITDNVACKNRKACPGCAATAPLLEAARTALDIKDDQLAEAQAEAERLSAAVSLTEAVEIAGGLSKDMRSEESCVQWVKRVIAERAELAALRQRVVTADDADRLREIADLMSHSMPQRPHVIADCWREADFLRALAKKGGE